MNKKIEEYNRVPVKVAAEYLGTSPQFIRIGLQQGRLPIGSAVQITNKKWTYYISPGLLKRFKNGGVHNFENTNN